MKRIENSYDAFTNAWKAVLGYVNTLNESELRNGIISLPPAVLVINDIKNNLDDKYQPYDIEFFDVDNTFALRYAFHNIMVDVSVRAHITDCNVALYIINRSNGFMVSATVLLKDLLTVFTEFEQIDLWERGPDIDAAILRTLESVGGRK